MQPGGGTVLHAPPSSLDPGLWDEYDLAEQMIPEWKDDGTYNPNSRLPSGLPSDHAKYPAHALDAGFNPNDEASKDGAIRFAQAMIGREGIHYVILGNQIWSTDKGLHPYLYGGHGSHVHVSEN